MDMISKGDEFRAPQFLIRSVLMRFSARAGYFLPDSAMMNWQLRHTSPVRPIPNSGFFDTKHGSRTCLKKPFIPSGFSDMVTAR
jgi:hypothetical protein